MFPIDWQIQYFRDLAADAEKAVREYPDLGSRSIYEAQVKEFTRRADVLARIVNSLT